MRVLATCLWILWQVFICQSLEIKSEFYELNEELCRKQARDPYFVTELVMGEPWRVYYSWNMNMDKKCFEMTFKNATKKIIRRIWSDMTDQMEQQPVWDSALLHLRTRVADVKHELLLFADRGPAGRFLGVPNIKNSEYKPSGSNQVPLLKFFMKLLHGRYLLVMDCHVGGATLAARLSDRVYRADVAAVAAALKLGDGYHACTNEKHKNEQLVE